MNLSPFYNPIITAAPGPRAADPIVGSLVVNSSLIIYNDGYYSLDSGATISTDTIGPDTEIIAPASTSISIILENTVEVLAKRISVPGGSLTVSGGGMLTTNNQDVAELSRRPGIRIYGQLSVSGGATLTGIGFTDGIYAANSGYNLVVTGNSTLIGQVTGANSSIINAAKYGVNAAGGIQVEAGSSIIGLGLNTSWNTYGVSADGSHLGRGIVCDGTITGNAEIGVYSGGPIIVGSAGVLLGTGGAHNISHGVQADNTYIVVNGGLLEGSCGAGAYAGVFAATQGITVNAGTLTGTGGINGVLAEGSAVNIAVTDGGAVWGTGSSIGVASRRNAGTAEYTPGLGNITVADSRLTGAGGRDGVLATGNITVSDGVVEGFTYAYGLDSSGYFGAVISYGTITADDESLVIENYSRIEYFNETFQLPYQNGKNMTSYLNYGWAISAGTGAVASDPGGAGIHATQSGSGTLTATRTGAVAAEVVLLDAGSTHIINIPVVLEVAAVPHTVTYDGNGATAGSVPVDSNEYFEGESVTVLGNEDGLVREGYLFAGWTLNPEGSGSVFQEGDTFLMPGQNVVLYALWVAVAPPPPPPEYCPCFPQGPSSPHRRPGQTEHVCWPYIG